MDAIISFLNTNYKNSIDLLSSIIDNVDITQPLVEASIIESQQASVYYTALITPPIIPPIVNPYSYINIVCIPEQIKLNLFCAKQQCTGGVTKQQGNVSKKMLQSKMVKYNGKYNVKYSYYDIIQFVKDTKRDEIELSKQMEDLVFYFNFNSQNIYKVWDLSGHCNFIQKNLYIEDEKSNT